jgi:hypothetical protein
MERVSALSQAVSSSANIGHELSGSAWKTGAVLP